MTWRLCWYDDMMWTFRLRTEALIGWPEELPGSVSGDEVARDCRREEMNASGDLWKERDSDRAERGIVMIERGVPDGRSMSASSDTYNLK